MALLLLVGNYLVSFDLTANPFKTSSGDDATSTLPSPIQSRTKVASQDSLDWWRPNPIDRVLLAWVRRNKGPRRDVEGAFVSCIIDVSDLQTFTGIAILTSGSLSLQCGSDADAPPPISAYPMAPTFFFTWRGENDVPGRNSGVNPYSPAICFLGLRYALSHFSQGYSLYTSSTFLGTVFSAGLLLFSFMSRTVKLFRPLSHFFNTSLRRLIGDVARRAASRVLTWTQPSNSQGASFYLWKHFCLRSVTALFLASRVIANLFASLLFEVW
ncbi:hypothetical protein GGTG_00589 [Gaeumannomyces tritici R3-111a-1]|uniref:Uncharacterized protein n=1 Tax=Gaeumannomyces tritici (strain R3-111a-1) TaxID=644352 RepID=J3NH51_GAET3|nr:hypothetical protein GGTG_00589 [Gaeumannomyces tritici R3-111a-1]EJT80594.1 hypothetical protein GGTG_00589 [Gaeumannomyces tritici R3-111a-1]